MHADLVVIVPFLGLGDSLLGYEDLAPDRLQPGPVGGPRPRTAAGIVVQAAWDGAARLRSTYCRIPP